MRHARVFALTGLAFAAATVAAWANQAAEPAPAADTTVVAVPDNAPVETAPLEIDLSKTHWGDAEAGAAAAATCAACHGVDGNPIDPMYPRLAGQGEKFIAQQLALFATGERNTGLAAGLPEERIHIERFGIALSPAGQAGAVEHQAQPGDAQTASITIVRDGLAREFSYANHQPSILDAASAAGLEVPFSCTSGVCGTCRAKCVEGEVRMERNYALDKAEVAAGFVLTCQCRPLTPQVTLSFDER